MKKTIRGQILWGYMLIVAVPIIITAVTIASLIGIRFETLSVSQNRENQNATKDAIVGHYSWIMGLGDTILEGKEFTGGLNPDTCSLGKWIATVSPEDLKDTAIASAIANLKIPHTEIHNSAQALINLSKTDHDKAYKEYEEQIKPKVSQIIADITIITNKYRDFAEESTTRLGNQIITLIIFCVILVAMGVTGAVVIGFRTAKRISEPIEVVANWSKRLALGSDDLDLHELDNIDLHEENEAAIMIKAFEGMVKSVKSNVDVVKKVADGDLTAFVDIRSSEDSLGKNLYRMVQSNDIMFAQILRIAGDVVANADQISKASEALANSATKQAGYTEQLSVTIAEVNDLTLQNKEKAIEVTTTFDRIQTDVNEGSDKMNLLVDAVDDIRIASDRISAVIKTIDDIAFQTNILALNAAVEAARAGSAGKGFAVVADEVRNLASKSAVAADETKELIENTISKTHYGSNMAKETSKTFVKIKDSLLKTSSTVTEIASASETQVEKIQSVHKSIEVLLAVSTSNAASCEQSSAASHQMYSSAGQVRQAMQKFNLRQRQYGTAYIPPEKRNDQEFIRIANENYKKAMESGKLDMELVGDFQR